jgi:hypothetical protein
MGTFFVMDYFFAYSSYAMSFKLAVPLAIAAKG